MFIVSIGMSMSFPMTIVATTALSFWRMLLLVARRTTVWMIIIFSNTTRQDSLTATHVEFFFVWLMYEMKSSEIEKNEK